MYRQAYQRGMLTIFFSVGSNPLKIWDTYTQDGYITRFLDQDIKSMVLEIGGTNVSTTYMICPKGNTVLGITMPFLVMVVKNLKKYFSFEVTILDETGTRRRFRVSNFQSTTQILPLCTVMPIGLTEGWNQIQFNLAEFTRRAYKKQFVEVQKLKINANIRLRRIYFAERIVPEDQLPAEYKLYFPLKPKVKEQKALQTTENEKNKENIKKEISERTIMEAKKDTKSEVSAGLPISTELLESVETIEIEIKPIDDTAKSRMIIVHEDGLDRANAMTAILPITEVLTMDEPTAEVKQEAEAQEDEPTAVEGEVTVVEGELNVLEGDTTASEGEVGEAKDEPVAGYEEDDEDEGADVATEQIAVPAE